MKTKNLTLRVVSILLLPVFLLGNLTITVSAQTAAPPAPEETAQQQPAAPAPEDKPQSPVEEDFTTINGGYTTWSDISGCTAPGANTVTTGGVSSGTVYVLGDSITNGAADKYRAKFTEKGLDSFINASGSSSWNGAGMANATTPEGSAKKRSEALTDDTTTVQSASAIVIALGTNGAEGSNPIDTIIPAVRAINQTAPIYWVNTVETGTNDLGLGEFNRALNDKASTLRYTVVSWAKVFNANADEYTMPIEDVNQMMGDNYVHPNGTGQDALVNAVVNAVSSGGVAPSPTGTGGCSCSVGTLLAGKDNQEKTWNFLISKGMTPVQAAGSMGNLAHEGGFEPKRLEYAYSDPPNLWESPDTLPPYHPEGDPANGGAGQPGLGIVQWTSPGRKENLLNFAKEKGLPIFDLGVQLEFMWSELEGPYKAAALDPILATDDLATVVSTWQDKYEVGTLFQPRMDAAEEFLAQYGSNTTTSSTSGSVVGGCPPAGGGQVIGGMSLPFDRSLFQEYEGWFSEPHHRNPDDPAIDLSHGTINGTIAYSMISGTVSARTDGCGIGIAVTSPDDKVEVVYCHGSDGGSFPGAEIGKTVNAGQPVMTVASTGESTGPHLHIEFYVDGAPVCIHKILKGLYDSSLPADLKSLGSTKCPV